VLAVLAAAFAGAAVSVAADRSALEGTFVLVEKQENVEKAIEAAIDKTVEPLNFVVRPIAKHRLMKTNNPYKRITIALPEGRVSIVTDARAPILTPDGGKPIQWKREDGEVFDVSARWENGVLKQTFEAPDGKRVNTFEVSDDGSELILEVTVTSEKLKKPLVYKVFYKRA
jgi:hypothetical protein